MIKNLIIGALGLIGLSSGAWYLFKSKNAANIPTK